MGLAPAQLVHTLDLRLLGSQEALAAHLVPGVGNEGHVLVDCGPGSTAARLYEAIADAGLEARDVGHLLLTHVHLDHAGAAGQLARELGLTVYVHAMGAPHLVYPERLLASATKVFGEQRMAELWGPFEAVPPGQLVVLEGGERLRVGGHTFEALYTPGHAVHHLAYALGGAVFAGDVAGVRRPGSDAVTPPTPPPDVDLEAWHESIALLRERQPDRLFLGHFGRVDNVPDHLDRLEVSLGRVATASLEGLRRGEDREAISERLRAALGVPGSRMDGERYRPASLSAVDVDGLTRYWQRRRPEALAGRGRRGLY